ncbi:hypothetical protein [Nocardia xishanensis]
MAVVITALVLAGLPAASLLLLQAAAACPLLALVLTGGTNSPRSKAGAGVSTRRAGRPPLHCDSASHHRPRANIS